MVLPTAVSVPVMKRPGIFNEESTWVDHNPEFVPLAGDA